DRRREIPREPLEYLQERLEPARRASEDEEIADDAVVVDHDLVHSRMPSGVRGRSDSTMARSRAAWSRAVAPRRRRVAESLGARPCRPRSSSSTASSSMAE